MSPDPSSNGNPPPARPNLLDMNIEPVDAAEVPAANAPAPNEPPTVQVARVTRRGFGFGQALLWCIVFLLVAQGIPAVILAVGIILVAMGKPAPAQPNVDFLASADIQPVLQITLLSGHLLGIALSVTVLTLFVGRHWMSKIALRLPSGDHVVLVVIAMPALLVLSIAAESVVTRYVPSLSDFGLPSVNEVIKGTRTWPWFIAVLLIGVGPAISEELWCRGFLGQGLALRYGNLGGALLTSFFFGLIHIEPPQAILAFLMGIVLHLSYLASRSILIPMLLHFMNNSIVILDGSESGPLPLASSLQTGYEHSPGMFLAAATLVLITVALMMYHSRVRIVTPSGYELPSSLYPHVETPVSASANQRYSDGLPMIEVGALLVALCLFVAVWYGL